MGLTVTTVTTFSAPVSLRKDSTMCSSSVSSTGFALIVNPIKTGGDVSPCLSWHDPLFPHVLIGKVFKLVRNKTNHYGTLVYFRKNVNEHRTGVPLG